ncbi:SRPBCC family protein [Brevundimonas staleyi]|uniref:SRPBCC family protein n=1 Tax=Brevundimonas staleyi TaxID=74326 RepID=A0ABW0FQN2_9CAUL|nr:SRPBCC family protein [Brevundimonas diminuta]MDM8353503.1 SRPBCC family protein [Brevundimonas diminuta]
MKLFTSDIVVDAPPENVWDILADIPAYPGWNRATRIEPDRYKPNEITYGMTAVRPNGQELSWRLTGRLLERRKPDPITWRLGMRGFVLLNMAYALTPRGSRTHVLFSAEVSGLIPRVFPNYFPNLLPGPMAGTLRDLKRRAETGARRSAPPPTTTKKPRHGGPPPRRR